MKSRKCSTCAYGERYDIDLFFCNKRGCAMFDNRAFEEISDCQSWASKESFKSGRCSECKFSEYDDEAETFTCCCDHARLFDRPDNEKERKNCSFCSPRSKEEVLCYQLSDMLLDPKVLSAVMEKHFSDYAEWFATNFPNGAHSDEEVLAKLAEE